MPDLVLGYGKTFKSKITILKIYIFLNISLLYVLFIFRILFRQIPKYISKNFLNTLHRLKIFEQLPNTMPS